MVARSAMLLAVLSACGASDAPASADAADVEEVFDAGMADAQTGFPRPGFGTISGDCDVLDDELSAEQPGLFQLRIDFSSLYTDADQALLTPGGQQLVTEENAGGSSVLSEAFAYEALARCEDALLLKTETQIVYELESKKTDFLAELDTLKIGVSVTRAMSFPFSDPYPVTQAEELLTGKLGDVLLSTEAVSDGDRWTKQILAILAYGPEHSAAVTEAYANLDADVRADTLVVLIQTDGADEFIYCNGPCD